MRVFHSNLSFCLGSPIHMDTRRGVLALTCCTVSHPHPKHTQTCTEVLHFFLQSCSIGCTVSHPHPINTHTHLHGGPPLLLAVLWHRLHSFTPTPHKHTHKHTHTCTEVLHFFLQSCRIGCGCSLRINCGVQLGL